MNHAELERINTWHLEGLTIAKDYARCEYKLVELLTRMHTSGGFQIYQCLTLREYAIAMWLLPENAASDMAIVARKAAEIPAMIEALKSRDATVSKLRKICPVITPDNQKEWLALVKNCSTRIVERTVAMAKPETAVKDQLTYKAGNLVELKTGISENVMLNLMRLQDLFSQKKRRSVSLSETVAMLAKFGLEKLDPVKKAERAQAREAKTTQSSSISIKRSELQQRPALNRDIETSTESQERSRIQSDAISTDTFQIGSEGQVSLTFPSGTHALQQVKTGQSKSSRDDRNVPKSISAGRMKLKAHLRHRIQLRDQAQCTHVNDSGERCSNRRWLEIHHEVPLSEGGLDELGNLRTLCSAHHRLTHMH